MSESLHTPTFNMKVVVRETGLKPDTLRAWERRYGIPNPNRTAGGHRLYSQHQIDMLKWLINRQDEGLSIRHAVELWQQMEASDDDPFALDVEERPLTTIPNGISGDKLSELRHEWLTCCLNFNEFGAQQILAQAFAQFPTETVCFELLQKNLNQIGQLWYEGEVTVQQEHFCSSLAIRQLEALLASAARPTQDVRLLVACPPHEQHTFGPLMLTLLFRRRGWNVVYLGANVPIARMETAVNAINPHLVILSAQTLYTAGTLRPMSNYLYDLNVPLAYGGAVFNYLEKSRAYLPGHYLGYDLPDVPEKVQHLIKSKEIGKPPTGLPNGYETAVNHFNEKRRAIEAHVQAHIHEIGLDRSYLHNANNDLGNNISAALGLGDINLLTANINWVQGLLMNYHYRMPEEAVETYIYQYQQAIEAHLDERGKPIKSWFKHLRKSKKATSQIRASSNNN